MKKSNQQAKATSIRLVSVKRLACGTINEIHEMSNGMYLNFGILDGRIQWEYMN